MPWTCSHGATYSDLEMECGMSFAHMDWLMEQERAEYELAADFEREEALGREHIHDPDGPEWPFYADRQWEAQEPEVFLGVLVLGVAL